MKKETRTNLIIIGVIAAIGILYAINQPASAPSTAQNEEKPGNTVSTDNQESTEADTTGEYKEYFVIEDKPVSPAAKAKIAEKLIETDTGIYGFGFSEDEAIAAGKLAKRMTAIHDLCFEGGYDVGSDTVGDIIATRYHAFAALTKKRILFLLQVPQLDLFAPDAVEYLNEMAWDAAKKACDAIGINDKEIIIGYRGIVSFKYRTNGQYDQETPEIEDHFSFISGYEYYFQ